jgi:hypothetical protein
MPAQRRSIEEQLNRHSDPAPVCDLLESATFTRHHQRGICTAKLLLIDEIHSHLRVPASSPEKQVLAARRGLRRREFQVRLRNAIEQILASYSSLIAVRLTIVPKKLNLPAGESTDLPNQQRRITR